PATLGPRASCGEVTAGRDSAWSTGDAPGPTRRSAGTSTLPPRRGHPLRAIGHAPQVPRGRRPMRSPPLPVRVDGRGSWVLSQPIGAAKPLPDSEIVHGQDLPTA